jgi:hypothetical protein
MSKVYNAVRDCIAHCRASTTPFLALNQFCSNLQTDPDWSSQDVEQVQAGAWQLLAALQDEPPSAGILLPERSAIS